MTLYQVCEHGIVRLPGDWCYSCRPRERTFCPRCWRDSTGATLRIEGAVVVLCRRHTA